MHGWRLLVSIAKSCAFLGGSASQWLDKTSSPKVLLCSAQHFRYNSLVTGTRAKGIIALCWVLSVGIGLTPMLGWNRGGRFMCIHEFLPKPVGQPKKHMLSFGLHLFHRELSFKLENLSYEKRQESRKHLSKRTLLWASSSSYQNSHLRSWQPYEREKWEMNWYCISRDKCSN